MTFPEGTPHGACVFEHVEEDTRVPARHELRRLPLRRGPRETR